MTRNAVSSSVALVLGGMLCAASAQTTISLTVVPSSPQVIGGRPIDVNLVVSGLQGATVPEIVSAFDLVLLYDPSVLSATSILYGGSLGEPSLFDEVVLTTPGVVDLAQLSPLDNRDLESVQKDSVTLATIRFNTLAAGTSPLTITSSDIKGLDSLIPLTVDVVHSSVTVVPEPSVFEANAGGPYVGNEGLFIVLDASRSSDPEDSITLYEWDLDNDGDFDDAAGLTTNVLFADNDTFIVGLRVTNASLESATDTAEVTVLNVAPAVDAGSDQAIDEGDSMDLAPVSFLDPGIRDTHAATIEWGDGSLEGRTLDSAGGFGTVGGTHSYPNDGIYTVRVTVRDNDGGASVGSFTVTVNNVAPSVEAGPNWQVDAGFKVTLPVTFSDTGILDTHTATVDWGDGSVENGSVKVEKGLGIVSGSHVYPEEGTFSVDVCVTDDGGATACDDFLVTVVPVLPDLVVDLVDRSSLTLDGQTLLISDTLKAKVTNKGDAPVVSDFVITFFEDVNGNATLDPSVDNVLGSASQDGLAAGATATVSGPASGTVLFRDNLIYAFVDSDEVVVEVHEANNTSSTGLACEFRPPVGGFAPVVKFHARQGQGILSTPMVANLTDDNGDGRVDERDIPDIVFVGSERVVAISGDDGHDIFTTEASIRVHGTAHVGVGDIDLDGFPEIVAQDVDARNLVAFEHTGETKWVSEPLEPPNVTPREGAVSIANLDGVGPPEIVLGAAVVSAEGALLGNGRLLGGTMGLNAIATISSVADVDLDGTPEIIAGPSAYRLVDGALTLVWHRTDRQDGFVGIANFDDDPFAEIVIVGRGAGVQGAVYILNHDGTDAEFWNPPTHAPVRLPRGEISTVGDGGPPTIADYDGDGDLEIGIAGATAYAVFERDGSLRWTSFIEDRSSSKTGSTPFDFEGDGTVEVVYRDEFYLRIYRGTDGFILLQTPMQSATRTEMPVVADVDGDGNAEIVVCSDNFFMRGDPIRDSGIYVIEDLNDTWVDARPIWNQHSYHITNINDDATVPLVEENNWERFNNYRQNVARAPFASPDLTASFVRVAKNTDTLLVTARIGNGGANIVGSGIVVSFYDGEPSAGDLVATVNTTAALEPGKFEDVVLSLPGNTATVDSLWVVADDPDPRRIPAGRSQNLSLLRATATASSSSDMTALPENAIDGDLATSWYAASTDSISRGGGPAVFEVTLLQDAVVSELRLFSDRRSGNNNDFRAGIFQLFDTTNALLFDSGNVTGPDFVVGIPDIGGVVRQIRFTATADVGDTPGIAEFEVIGRLVATGIGQVNECDETNNTHDSGLVLGNGPAAARPGGPYMANEGAVIRLDGSGSFDSDSDPLRFEWRFQEQSFPGVFLDISLPDDFSDTAILTVDDGRGGIDRGTTTVTFNNVPPTVEAGPSRTVNEGDTLSLASVMFSDPGVQDKHTATIYWGDGSIEPGAVTQGAGSGSVASSHVYADEGVFQVAVTVTDDDGGVGIDSFTVTVLNVAASVDAGADRTVTLDDEVSLPPATFTDPGTLDTHSATIDWDDGIVEAAVVAEGGGTGSLFGVHSYRRTGDYLVTVTVTDEDGAVGSDNLRVRVNPSNTPPVADAQTVVVEQDTPTEILLTASDADGDNLTFEIVTEPLHGSLSGTPPALTYAPDLGFSGLDSLSFMANDGRESSNLAAVTITVEPANNPPVAVAGPDQNVETGTRVKLNGSDSFDPDSDLITFDWSVEWSLDAKPDDSLITDQDVEGRDTPTPSFIPDVDGRYIFRLVVKDQDLDSLPDYVEITARTPNVPPNADAGQEQNVVLGDAVLLDGSGSKDPDSGPSALVFLWEFKSLPSESFLENRDIQNANHALASFIPDVIGRYVLRLSVSDGEDTNEADVNVVVSAANVPPNASAGDDRTLQLGEEVVLDASASNDPDNGPEELAYAWSFVSVATGSGLTNADLVDASTAMPRFTPDVAGSYLLQLEVFDGAANDFDNVVVTAQEVTLVLCDVDGDRDVDSNDISAIFVARNMPAAPGDPRDTDGDGIISVNDARICVLQCSRVGCKP